MQGQYMIDDDEKISFQARLGAHRVTLAILLRQLASLGADYAPPGIHNGIAEARAAIARLKAHLRASDVAVEDLADDLANESYHIDRDWRGIRQQPGTIESDTPPFTEVFPTDLPYPIAAICFEANSARSDKERFESLDLLLNNLIQYLTAIALSHYWQDRPNKEQLQKWLAGLTRSALWESP